MEALWHSLIDKSTYIEKEKGYKGTRTGCVKKPCGKKLPACSVKLILRNKEKSYTTQASG